MVKKPIITLSLILVLIFIPSTIASLVIGNSGTSGSVLLVPPVVSPSSSTFNVNSSGTSNSTTFWAAVSGFSGPYLFKNGLNLDFNNTDIKNINSTEVNDNITQANLIATQTTLQSNNNVTNALAETQIRGINSSNNIRSIYENNSLVPCANVTGATSNLCTIVDTKSGTNGFYLYNTSTTILFNESQLNTTILALSPPAVTTGSLPASNISSGVFGSSIGNTTNIYTITNMNSTNITIGKATEFWNYTSNCFEIYTVNSTLHLCL